MKYDVVITADAYMPQDPIGHYLSEYVGLDSKELMHLINLTFNYGMSGYAILVTKSKNQEE